MKKSKVVTKKELSHFEKKDKTEDKKMILEAIKHHEKAMHHHKVAHNSLNKALHKHHSKKK